MGDANDNVAAAATTNNDVANDSALDERSEVFVRALEIAQKLRSEIGAEEFTELLSQLSNRDIYRIFAVNLLFEQGYTQIDNAEGEVMVDKIVERLEVFVNQELALALPEEQSDKLDDMIEDDTATPEAIAALYKEAGLDMSELTGLALEKFRKIYLGIEGE